jgi:dephospho-CoA kinase
MDALVVVTAEREVRIDRLLTRNGLDRRQAELRLAAQLPQRDKAALADYLIDNSGPLEQTRARVQQVWVDLERRAATQIMDGS